MVLSFFYNFLFPLELITAFLKFVYIFLYFSPQILKQSCEMHKQQVFQMLK